MLLRSVAAGGRAAVSASRCSVSSWWGWPGGWGGSDRGNPGLPVSQGPRPQPAPPAGRAASDAAGPCCPRWARSRSAGRAALLLGRAPELGRRVLAPPPSGHNQQRLLHGALWGGRSEQGAGAPGAGDMSWGCVSRFSAPWRHVELGRGPRARPGLEEAGRLPAGYVGTRAAWASPGLKQEEGMKPSVRWAAGTGPLYGLEGEVAWLGVPSFPPPSTCWNASPVTGPGSALVFSRIMSSSDQSSHPVTEGNRV